MARFAHCADGGLQVAFIQKLMNSATGAASAVGAQAKAAAKQAAREVQLPALIVDKAGQLQKIDKEINSIGWSPTPELKARKVSWASNASRSARSSPGCSRK